MFKIHKPILLALVFLCASLLLTAYSKYQLRENQAQPVRPNIVLILTDDQDLRSIAFMPQLKALLIDQGTMFENFFVNVSLCCPSRVSILRGQYAHNHKVLTNYAPSGGFQKFHKLGLGNSTIATWLQAAGYRTALVGKFLNGYPDGERLTYMPSGWDEWYSPVGGYPYSNFNYKLNENGRIVKYRNRSEDYLTDVLTRKAADFIRRTANDNKPFFIYLATYAPHSPATPPIRYQGKFAGMKAPRLPSYNEQYVSDKPQYIRNRAQLGNRRITQLDEFYRNYLRSLLAVDDMIDNLIKTLETTGTLENTYIFFTSDNGRHFGEHRVVDKRVPYEESIRVPMIVRGPGVPAGQILKHFGANIDLAPTFAELAGISWPNFVDGRSLVPLLHRKTSVDVWREVFLIENWDRGRNITKTPDFQAIRTKDYLYVEYGTGERELYDLHTDPYQLQNLYMAASPALITRLSSRLNELRHCARGDCRIAENKSLN